MMELWRLFLAFLQIGLFSIGGGYAVIPAIQQQVVETYEWISQRVFTDILTISQMTPGPLAVNTSTFVGIRIAGVPGAVVATIGCILPGVTLSLLLYAFFQRHSLALCGGGTAWAQGGFGRADHGGGRHHSDADLFRYICVR